jgi:hypothetical protein
MPVKSVHNMSIDGARLIGYNHWYIPIHDEDGVRAFEIIDSRGPLCHKEIHGLATYQVLYWHDIPLQVRAGGRRDRHSQALDDRFQVCVDKAAMLLGMTDDDAYMDGLSWSEPKERAGDPADVLSDVVAELEAANEQIDWRAMVARLRQGSAPTDGALE